MQQGELLKKAVIASPDTVDKTTPASPRALGGDKPQEEFPSKGAAASASQDRQSIFEKKELKRSANDFDMLKVRLQNQTYFVF